MSTKQERMSAAAGKVGKDLTRARKPRPARKAFAVLAEASPVADTSPAEPKKDEAVEVAEAVAVLAPVGQTATNTSNDSAPGAEEAVEVESFMVRQHGGDPALPAWTTLCVAPARRGTAGQQRRFNIPIAYSVLDRINEIDAAQLIAGQHKINRSVLFEAAVNAYAAAPAHWVSEWELSDPVPATTSLQGRVSDQILKEINKLRYLDTGGAVRAVNPGPILSLIIARILVGRPSRDFA